MNFNLDSIIAQCAANHQKSSADAGAAPSLLDEHRHRLKRIALAQFGQA